MTIKALLMGATALTMATTAPISASFAQDAAEDGDREKITVTARRVEESATDVPISLSAFTAADLEEKQIVGITDIADFTTGFQFQPAFGRDGDRPVIRGASNILISEGKVGYFIDGIPLTGDIGGLSFDNLQQIEVIKGPQAAVFGRGTLSGAINFITKRPGDEHEFNAKGTLGNYERMAASASWSGPINSWLGGYLGASYDSFGGDFDNLVEGDMLNERESQSLSAFLYFDPTPNISGSVRLIHQEIDDGHFAIDLQPSSLNNAFPNSREYFVGEVAQRPDSEYGLNTSDVLNPGVERETQQALFNIDWNVGGSDVVLSYIGGVTSQDEVSGVDQTYDETTVFFLGRPLPFPPFFGRSVCQFSGTNADCANSAFNGTGASTRNVVSHELRVSTPTDLDVRASAGAFVLNEKRKGVPMYLEATEFGLDTLGDRLETDNLSFFASIEADFTDRLTAGLELRHSRDEISRTGQAYGASQFFDPAFLATLTGTNLSQVVGNTNSRSATFEATLPRATLRYRLNDELNFYAQYAQGNSPGGFNPEDAPETTIDEELLTNYEIGLKGSIPGSDVAFNLALFKIIYENQNLTQTYLTSAGGVNSYTSSLGETEINGFEVDGSTELFDGFTISGTMSYLDAQVTEGINTDQGILLGGIGCLTGFGTTGSFTPTPACEEIASIVGKTPPLVSKWQSSLSGLYSAPTGYGDWEWFAGADLIYRSSFYAQIHNLAETGDSTKVNLQAGLESGNFRLSVWGKNVTDDQTALGILRYVDFDSPTNATTGQRVRGFGVTPSPKPTYGVTASVRF